MQPVDPVQASTPEKATPLGADQDRSDVARVLSGDTEAFAGIVRRWERPLYQLAFRFCRDRTRAEDMTQEAFLRAFRSLAQWRGESAFSTWLLALAANAYRSHLRSSPPRFEPLELASMQPDGHEPDRAGEAAGERVRRSVACLPGRYRDALVAFYFRGKDVREAAELLGVREGTLKARLHRGRGLLEGLLRTTQAPAKD